MNINLHPRQYTAFSSRATEILYGGAAGGGKSFLIRVALIIWCAAIPGLQCYLFRRTFPDLMKNHVEGPTSFPVLLAEWVKAKLARITYDDMAIRFWNGSTIFLCHCQHEKDKFKYQGAEIHVLMVDELTHFTKSIYSYLRARVRMAGIKLPPQYEGLFPRILSGSNPGGVGHNWVKFDFVDKGLVPFQTCDDDEGGMLRQYIPAKLEDNPTLMEEDPKYLARLAGLGNPALVKAMRDGDWNIVSGGMFDDLWSPAHHIYQPFPIPGSWYVDRAFDWGSSKPFSVGWWAESDGSPVTIKEGVRERLVHFPRGSLFLVAEWYGWNGTPNEGLKMMSSDIAKGIKERERFMAHKVHPGPADNSIFDAVDGKSIASEMAREGVKWERSDKSPGSRKTGWQRMRDMLQEARKERPENAILGVFSTCHQWIRNVPALPRDERNPDDVDSDAEDHDGDQTRYRVMHKRVKSQVKKLGGM
ncbi:terminase large subunit domain-containing protein [Immundisolibacter sp.]